MARYQESVHWHEGLFLRPQHLQMLQRGLLSQARADRSLLNFYPYGVGELELAEDALANFVVKLDRLEAILQSGLEISMPGNAEIPPLNMKAIAEQRREPLLILLAVPIWTASQPNVCDSDDGEIQRRVYKTRETKVFDENNGENEQSITVRKINARLVIEGDNVSDMETIPLLRVIPSFEDGVAPSIKLDRRFIPPCLSMSGSLELANMVSSLLEQLSGYREELLAGLRRAGFTPDNLSGPQAARILQLRSLNVYIGRMESMLSAGRCSPYQIYLELGSLIGELAALMPLRDLHEVAPYNHDNCQPVFSELIARIRNLTCQESGSYVKIQFAWDEALKCLTADLTEEHIMKAEDFYLAVQCDESSAKLISLIEAGDQFKLTAKSAAGARVRGVKLKEERYPPPVLPPMHNVIWFKLRRAESVQTWNRIKEELKIALACSQEIFPQLKASLYGTVFSTQNGEAAKK